MLYVNLGVDPLGVFHTGVSNTFNISFALALFIENMICLVIVYFLDKKYINIATICGLFVVSLVSNPITSFYTMVLGTNLSLIARYLLLFVACFIISVGLNFYVLADLGTAAIDAFPEMIAEKTDFEIGPVKIVVDLAFLGVGIFLGGTLGVGTLISAFAVGPIIQVTRKVMQDPIAKFINNWDTNTV